MRISAFVVGLIAGLIGVVTGLLTIGVGGISLGIRLVGSGFGALALSGLGIIGALTALPFRRLGGILMLIAGIGGFLVVSYGWIIAGPLFIIAAILAFTRDND